MLESSGKLQETNTRKSLQIRWYYDFKSWVNVNYKNMPGWIWVRQLIGHIIVVYLLAQGVHNAEEVLEKINIELGRQEQGWRLEMFLMFPQMQDEEEKKKKKNCFETT